MAGSTKATVGRAVGIVVVSPFVAAAMAGTEPVAAAVPVAVTMRMAPAAPATVERFIASSTGSRAGDRWTRVVPIGHRPSPLRRSRGRRGCPGYVEPMSDNDRWVVEHPDGGWAVEKEDRERVSDILRTQEEAV